MILQTDGQIDIETNVITGSALAIDGDDLVNKDQLIAYTEYLIEQIHNSGSTVTINENNSVLIVDPTSLLAALTITLPPSPVNGDIVQLLFGGTITSGPVVTSLTISPNSGQTLLGLGAITTANAGDGYIIRYRSSNTTWYPY